VVEVLLTASGSTYAAVDGTALRGEFSSDCSAACLARERIG
jgi:hypothetical protein